VYNTSAMVQGVGEFEKDSPRRERRFCVHEVEWQINPISTYDAPGTQVMGAGDIRQHCDQGDGQVSGTAVGKGSVCPELD